MRVQLSTVTAETNTSTGVGTSPQTDVDLNQHFNTESTLKYIIWDAYLS